MKKELNWEPGIVHTLGKFTQSNTHKIAELSPAPCNHPEHNPPNMQVFTDGVWSHTCPKCGNSQTFTVRNPTL